MARQLLGIADDATEEAPSPAVTFPDSVSVRFSRGDMEAVAARWNRWWRDCLAHLDIVPGRFPNQKAEHDAFLESYLTKVGRGPEFEALADCPPLRDAAQRADEIWIERFSRIDHDDRRVVDLIYRSIERVYAGDPVDLDCTIHLSIVPVEGLWQYLSPPGVACISAETMRHEPARDKLVAALLAT